MSITTISLSNNADFEWSELFALPQFESFIKESNSNEGGVDVVLKREDEGEAEKFLSLIGIATRKPVIATNTDYSLRGNISNIEYICSDGITERFGSLTEQRVDALVDSLLGTINNDEVLRVEAGLEEKVEALFRELKLSLLYLDLNHTSAYIVLDEPLSRLIGEDGFRLEAGLTEILPSHFIQIALTASEPVEIIGEVTKEQTNVVHEGKWGKYSISELEVFRSQIERLAVPILNGARISEEDGKVIITAPDSPQLLWFKKYLERNLNQFPLEIQILKSEAVDNASDFDTGKLLTFAFGKGCRLIKKGDEEYCVVYKSGYNYSLKEVESSFATLFGKEISIIPVNYLYREKSVLSSFSPWAQEFLSPYLNEKGEVIKPISIHVGTEDETLHIEPFHVASSWDLPLRDPTMIAIAEDPPHSVSDVAFGVKKEGNEICLKGWAVNLSRLIPIGSEIDEEVSLRCGSLYGDNGIHPLYPPKFAKRYLALSTQFPRPMIEYTMYINTESKEVFLGEVKEVQGTIDHILTPGAFRKSKGNLGRCRDLFHELSEVLQERGKRIGRIELHYEYDPMVREPHLLLYELIGDWMSLNGSIAVPYRVCSDPLRNVNPMLRNLIVAGTSPDAKERFSNRSTRRSVLLDAVESASVIEKERMYKALGIHSSHAIDVFSPHFLLGVNRYLRVGSALRYDLSRVIQHQVTAALKGLSPLPREEVAARLKRADRFDSSRGASINERKTLISIRNRSFLVGNKVLGEISEIDSKSSTAKIKINNNFITVFSPQLTSKVESGERVSLHLKAYSLSREAYIAEILQ